MVVLGLQLWPDICRNRRDMTIKAFLSAVDSVEFKVLIGIHKVQ